MSTFTYITQDGQCWDNVAVAVYGDPLKMLEVAAANPHVPLDAVLPGGIELQVPILENEDTNVEELPPWKR